MPAPQAISVVVPTKNAGPGFAPLCRHLQLMQARFDLEVLIIDSGSRDGTVAEAERAGFRVHRIAPAEFGHGRTRNRGVRMTAGEIVCFLTQDVLPCTPDWPARFADALRDPRVAGVYGRQVPRDASTVEMFFVALNYPAEPGRLGRDHAVPRPGRVVFSNAFSATRREVWKAFPFPEDVPVSEDQAWAEGVLRAGYEIAYEPGAEALHAHRYTLGGLFRRHFLLAQALASRGLDRVAGPVEAVKFLAREVGYFVRQGHAIRVPQLLVYEFVRWLALQAGLRRGRRQAALSGLGQPSQAVEVGRADRFGGGTKPGENVLNHFKPAKQIGVGGLELGARERAYLHQVIESNRLSYGPFSERFERLFAEVHDCRFAAFCSSGTAALHLGLAALGEKHGWENGDEVVVPAVSFVATSNMVLQNNLRPVFVDVDPKTYNIDPALIEARLSQRTRAVLPVHLMGLPCDMEPIWKLAATHGLKIVEDSCETMFARYRGRRVGSLGDVACFSTYIAHFIVAGIGGFVTTNDPDLATLMRSLMNHGRDNIYIRIDDDQGVPRDRLLEIVAKRFSFVRLGYNFRPTELEAAMGLAQLEARDEIIRKRRENAEFFLEKLADLEDVLQLPYVPPDRDHMFMLFPIVVRNGPKRDLVNFLEESLIETRDLMPLISQPVNVHRFGELEDQYPVARWLNQSGFYIGCHQYLTDGERSYIVEKIHEFFGRR